MTLYKQNMMVSHEFYVIIHVLEVCLRNKIDNHLAHKFGKQWYANKNLTLTLSQNEMLRKTEHPDRHGKLIASLSFGFWTSFFDRIHEELWRHDLRYIFKSPSLNRKTVASYLKEIRTLRNRIAHHECILKNDTNYLKTISFELIDWLSNTALDWLQNDLLINLPQTPTVYKFSKIR